jgi:molybdopterin molybdotransferase
MQSVEAARARILAALSATPPETVALAEAAGRVLARPVTARLTQPPSAVSAMDGYALRAADAPLGARLRVVGEAPAGHPFTGQLSPGEAVRIFTGAFIPHGADSILLQEDATAEGGTVLVREAVTPGRWVRPAGLDFTTGESLLAAGRPARCAAPRTALRVASASARTGGGFCGVVNIVRPGGRDYTPCRFIEVRHGR